MAAPPDASLLDVAENLLATFRSAGRRIATAESCTGGLIAATLTEIAGSSDVFDRGFVTYSNEAKTEMLCIPAQLIERHGAVSAEVAEAMAIGCLRNSGADVAIAVTGVAGPGGGTTSKPVGLVYVAAAGRDAPTVVVRHLFGDVGRATVRQLTVRAGLELALRQLAVLPPA